MPTSSLKRVEAGGKLAGSWGLLTGGKLAGLVRRLGRRPSVVATCCGSAPSSGSIAPPALLPAVALPPIMALLLSSALIPAEGPPHLPNRA